MSPSPPGRKPRPPRTEPVGVRIIGGRFRGRKIHYSGDPRTRPMKDRVREAVFNLLGTAVRGKHAIDLFAGTGALGLEALSRGAAAATFVEQHHPTAKALGRSAAELGVEAETEVVVANTFLWFRRQPKLPAAAWLVFCSPPYDFYVARREEMLELIGGLLAAAPPESLFVVECDMRFALEQLPEPEVWDVRCYPPAVVAIYERRKAEGGRGKER
jgi:16S rRNA (guanine966-N2)-methyltransferase